MHLSTETFVEFFGLFECAISTEQYSARYFVVVINLNQSVTARFIVLLQTKPSPECHS